MMKLLNLLFAIIGLLCIIGLISGNDLSDASETINDKLNCSKEFCPMIPSECPSGQKLFTEKCCPRCENCTEFRCPKETKCETGYHPIKDDKHCCDTCVKCNPLICPRIVINCEKGSHPAIPLNKCCTECVKCTQECPLINCITGSELYIPKNECCPKCRLMNQSETK